MKETILATVFKSARSENSHKFNGFEGICEKFSKTSVVVTTITPSDFWENKTILKNISYSVKGGGLYEWKLSAGLLLSDEYQKAKQELVKDTVAAKRSVELDIISLNKALGCYEETIKQLKIS